MNPKIREDASAYALSNTIMKKHKPNIGVYVPPALRGSTSTNTSTTNTSTTNTSTTSTTLASTTIASTLTCSDSDSKKKYNKMNQHHLGRSSSMNRNQRRKDNKKYKSKSKPTSTTSTTTTSTFQGEMKSNELVHRGHENKKQHEFKPELSTCVDDINDNLSNSLATLNINNNSRTTITTNTNNKKTKSSKKGDGNSKNKKPKNTNTFEPRTTVGDMRVLFGLPGPVYNRLCGPRDVIMVPELLSKQYDYTIYERLLQELCQSTAGSQAEDSTKQMVDCDGYTNASTTTTTKPTRSLFKLWHNDSHLIADDNLMGGKWKYKCPTFEDIVATIGKYFAMDIKATRFNWYRGDNDWKPYHHDAAAIKSKFAKIQNYTVAVSFGRERVCSFEHAKTRLTIDMPQPNGCIYAFGKDVNIEWKHGVLQPDDNDNNKKLINNNNNSRENTTTTTAAAAAATSTATATASTTTDDTCTSTTKEPDGRISIVLWGWIDTHV